MAELTQPAPDGKAAELPDGGAPEGSVAPVVALSGGDIEIYTDRPLPQFSNQGALAFAAQSKHLSTRQIAVLCDRSYVPRASLGASYKSIKSATLMQLLDMGIVDWPDGRQYLAYVFDRPAGRKILSAEDAVPHPVAPERLAEGLILPFIGLLEEFRNADMVHGNIHLENLYLSGGEGAEILQVGECLTGAPSSRQHMIYMPIEKAMAQPMGRGLTTLKDDLYAFGICLMMLLRGQNLMQGRSPRKILEDKIENTSYSALLGQVRMPPGVGEFLRGVLNDDETQRWGVDEALRWAEGQRHSARQPRRALPAARPYLFMDRKFYNTRLLAVAMAENIPQAADEMHSNGLLMWVKRNFEDASLEEALENIAESEKGSTKDKIVARLCMALDPRAPLRFRHVSFFPSGLGQALAAAAHAGEDMQAFADSLNQQLVHTWISQRYNDLPDAGNLMSAIERSRNALAQKMPGYGLERVLYDLDREAPCMSPVFKDFMIVSPGHLLVALERLARRGALPERVFDRHMVAYISVREPKAIDPHLGHVVSHDAGNQPVGILRTLAAIQARYGTGPVPALTSALVGMLAPAYERFSDRDRQEAIRQQLEKRHEEGDLSVLLALVDNVEELREDARRAAVARQEYKILQQEKASLSAVLKGSKHVGYATGRQVAMLVASAIATVAMTVYVIVKMAG